MPLSVSLKTTNILWMLVALFSYFISPDIAKADALVQKNTVPYGHFRNKTVKKTSKKTNVHKSANAAQGQRAKVSPKEWGPYLDIAYELTYWDNMEIKSWRERSELDFNETLSHFISTWNKNLMEPPIAIGAGAFDNGVAYQERDYIRLAAAKTLDFLETHNRESLNGANQVLDRLKEKNCMPRVAYWSGFVKALQAIEDRDSAAFVEQVYAMWHNSIRYIETSAITTHEMAGNTIETHADTSIPHLYRNLVTLVARRAILQNKLDGLDALGPLFVMLKERDLQESEDNGRYLTTLVQRVNEIFTAPDLDRRRLNFAVALIEADRQRLVAQSKIDKGMSEDSRNSFEKSREFYGLARKWAASSRSCGSVSVIADYLDTSSFAIQRLRENSTIRSPAFAYFATLPGHDGAETLHDGMAIFSELAKDNAWEKAGYADEVAYKLAMRRLWRAIMEFSLWSGDYYLGKLQSTDNHEIIPTAASLQGALSAYINFFTAQTESKAVDLVPASAYFGAAEAAQELSYSYRLTYDCGIGLGGYKQWFINRLLAVELFPINDSLLADTADTLKIDGRYDLFLEYFLPLVERVNRSRDLVTLRDTVAKSQKQSEPSGPSQGNASAAKDLKTALRRDPEHDSHKLLKAFYQDELRLKQPFTLLLKYPDRLRFQ